MKRNKFNIPVIDHDNIIPSFNYIWNGKKNKCKSFVYISRVVKGSRFGICLVLLINKHNAHEKL